MTTPHDDADLEAFFAAARDTSEPPPPDLMAAILRAGFSAQPVADQPVPARPPQARSPRPARRLPRIGWPEATALAACLLAGLIAGLAGPGLLDAENTTDPAADILAFYDLATETDG